MARRKPASKIVSARLGPTDQKRLGQVNQLEIEVFPNPPEALNKMLGKYAAFATPICAFAWATPRSAAAMSGRRSRSSEGMPTGVAGGFASSSLCRKGECRCRLTNQDSNGVFILGAQDSEVGVLSLCRSQLGLGLRHSLVITEAGSILALGQIQSVLVSDYSGVEYLLERVLCAKFIVIHREFRLFAQAHILQIGGAGLRRVDIGPYAAPNMSPEIGFPRGIKRQRVICERFDAQLPKNLPVCKPPYWPGDGREFMMLGLVETVGKYCDRACLTRARAARKLAAAAAMFWFEETAFSSSSLSWGSWNASHHLPRIAASFGRAIFHWLSACEASCESSL